jgi:nucleoside-diphosphate-sugar epimerase
MERQQAPFDLVNVGSGQAVSITDLVREIIRISGKPLSIEHDLTAPNLPVDICLDISRARAVYEWRPSHSLEEGIRKTIAWYRQHVLPAFSSPAGDTPASPPGLKSAA